MPELSKSCSLFLFIGFVYFLKQTKEVTVRITFTTLCISNQEILSNTIIIKSKFRKIKWRDIMLCIICSWIFFNAIPNFQNELLWNVYGAIDCVFISDRNLGHLKNLNHVVYLIPQKKFSSRVLIIFFCEYLYIYTELGGAPPLFCGAVAGAPLLFSGALEVFGAPVLPLLLKSNNKVIK